MRYICVLMLLALLAGCDGATGRKKTKSDQPSVAEEVIDGATGRTALKHGKRAMETVKRVSAQEQQDLKEVLE